MKKLALLALMTGSIYAQNIYATFKVAPQREASLAFSAGGIVAKVNTDIGKVVKKGDILARLQNDDLKALLSSAAIARKYAKRTYDRQHRVKDTINKTRLDASSFKYYSAIAHAKYQKSLLNKTYLKAPFDGVIFYKKIEVGDVVSGMAPRTVLKIQSQHKRKLILSFDQKYSSIVKVGDTFKYQIDGADKSYTGKITKVYPTIDMQSRQATAEVATEGFMPGVFGTGNIEIKGE